VVVYYHFKTSSSRHTVQHPMGHRNLVTNFRHRLVVHARNSCIAPLF
jgi:hypothetical protein